MAPPSRAGSSRSRPGTQSRTLPPPTILCNACTKPLTTTCFLTACDCIFCEDCTYNHFENSSKCPKCSTELSERDFTELIITDASNSTTQGSEYCKTTLQALFSRQKAGGSGSLPFSDLCFGLIRQVDMAKQSTKFLLKQMVLEMNMSNRRQMQWRGELARCKQEITHIKQNNQRDKMEYEQALREANAKVQAREQELAEMQKTMQQKDKMLEQFHRLHGNSVSGGVHIDGSANATRIPASAASHRGLEQSTAIENSRARSAPKRGGEPGPLQAIMMNKEAQRQQQKALLKSSSSRPHILGNMIAKNNGHHLHGGRGHSRPFSSASSSINSTGGMTPSTPRIRQLTSSSGYHFTASSGGRDASRKRNIDLSPNMAFAQQPRRQWSSGSSTFLGRR